MYSYRISLCLPVYANDIELNAWAVSSLFYEVVKSEVCNILQSFTLCLFSFPWSKQKYKKNAYEVTLYISELTTPHQY